MHLKIKSKCAHIQGIQHQVALTVTPNSKNNLLEDRNDHIAKTRTTELNKYGQNKNRAIIELYYGPITYK